jgi:putative tryptophan/tyrosine transport system substrate-binding protein
VRRREFIGLVGGVAAWPLVARAQQAKVPRVAFVTILPLSVPVEADPVAKSFAQRLRDLGYVDGQNLTLEWYSADNQLERLPGLMREVVASNVDVILSTTWLVTRAAKDVTSTVPIVMATSATPVESGFAQSISKPGGNITGLTTEVNINLSAKRLQLLKELLPDKRRLAWLVSPTEMARGSHWWKTIETASRDLGWELLIAEHAPKDYTSAFALIIRERPDALFVNQQTSNYGNRELIVAFAAQYKLPAMYPTRQYLGSGGLMSYGSDLTEQFRRAAEYVDLILKGTKPGDLPIELPRKFELVINMKTARELGITVPPTLLAFADELIE